MNSECSICFEIVRSTEIQKPFVTRCGHLFHENCIRNCLQNQTFGKCPQCNQGVVTSQLIRLFVNEPENSIQVKDQLIEQLKIQLNELNEKAQLQYDLIGALNRQISLEAELSKKENARGWGIPATSNFTFRSPNAAKPIVAPAKLKNVQSKFSIPGNKEGRPLFKYPFEPVPQATFGPSTFSEDGKTNKAMLTFGDTKTAVVDTLATNALRVPSDKQNTFSNCSTEPMSRSTFGSSNFFESTKINKTMLSLDDPSTSGDKWDTFGACALNVPKWKDFQIDYNSENGNAIAHNEVPPQFTFGSNAIPNNFNPMGFRSELKESSTTASPFDLGDVTSGQAATQSSIASSTQNTNLFAPTKKGKTLKPFSKFKSPSSTNGHKKNCTGSSSDHFSKWSDTSLSSNTSADCPTFNSSSGTLEYPTSSPFDFLHNLNKSSSASDTNDQTVQDISAAMPNQTTNDDVKSVKVSPEKEDTQ